MTTKSHFGTNFEQLTVLSFPQSTNDDTYVKWGLGSWVICVYKVHSFLNSDGVGIPDIGVFFYGKEIIMKPEAFKISV